MTFHYYFEAHVFSRLGYHLSGVSFSNAHASRATKFSCWLVSCSVRVCVQFRCCHFWYPFTRAHASQAQRFSQWLVSCSAHVWFQLGCYLAVPPLPTPIASQAQRLYRWLVSCSARFSHPQFEYYLSWSLFLCSPRSLTTVPSAQRFNDSWPTD